jgi:serine phosphatase RsbU (regulator of sigma subunit)
MRSLRPVPALTIAALLLVTVAAAYAAWQAERDDAGDQNRSAAEQAAIASRRVMESAGASLRGAEGLLDPAGRMRPAGFRAFARPVLESIPFPAMAWAPLVRTAERPAYERSIGAPIVVPVGQGEVRRAPRRRRYLPVTLVVPGGNFRSVLGFDLLADPVRANAIGRAQATGRPQISRPIRVAGPDRAGATMITTLYGGRGAGSPGSPRTLAGVIATGLDGTLLGRAVRRQIGDVDLEISDGETLARSGEVEDGESATIPVGGRTWSVSVDTVAEASLVPVVSIGLLGLTLTSFLTAFFVSQSRRERRLEEERAAAEREAEREGLLASTVDALEQQTTVDERLEALASAMVPALAELCVVHEVTRDGDLRQAGVAARSPELEQAVRGSDAPGSPVTGAIASRRPSLLTPEQMDMSGLAGEDPEARERSRPRSAIVAPLIGREKPVGAISLVRLESAGRPPFDQEALELVREVAEQGAYALENAQLYERERSIATALQRALLPGVLPRVDGIELSASYRAGEVGSRVGGDVYDAFVADGGIGLLVADVSGKGAGAAALTGLVRHTFRAALDEDPAGAVAVVDGAMRSEGRGSFCTLAAIRLGLPGADGAAGRACVAGHPQPRIIRAGGTVERVPSTGPLVGVVDDPRFESLPVHLQAGDAAVLFTDGLTEARGAEGLFGDDRLDQVLGACAGLSAQEIVGRLLDEWSAYATDTDDDVVVLALRLSGPDGIG